MIVVTKAIEFLKGRENPKNFMDISTVNLILKCCKFTKSSFINQKLSLINSKIDQLIVADVFSAFSAINDALTTNNESTRNIRLIFAEEKLLKSTGLNPTLKTNKYNNSYLISLSHYGLALLCSIRNDTITSAKHVLKAFLYDTRKTRNEILPELYQALFKKECYLILQEKERKLAAIQKKDYTLQVTLITAGMGLSDISIFAIKHLAARITASKQSPHEKQINRLREVEVKNLNEKIEVQIDDMCKTLATCLLEDI